MTEGGITRRSVSLQCLRRYFVGIAFDSCEQAILTVVPSRKIRISSGHCEKTILTALLSHKAWILYEIPVVPHMSSIYSRWAANDLFHF